MARDGFIVRIRPTKDGWDFTRFVVDVANNRIDSLQGCEVGLVQDVVASFQEQFMDYVMKHGFSSLVRRMPLLEALVPPGAQKTAIVSILVGYLSTIGVADELVIVDPYFYASQTPADPSYPTTVASILAPFAASLSSVKVVTLPKKVDLSVKAAVDAEIVKLNPSIAVTHTTSDEYHDRFWISSKRSAGVLVGTSVNGLGKRYAIVDRLESVDVTDIVASLTARSLI